MTRPHALLRAGFPYLKTIGTFRKTDFPTDVAFGSEGRIYVLCHWGKGKDARSGPISVLNIDDEDLGALDLPGPGLVHRPPVADGQLMHPGHLILDAEERLYVSDQATHRINIYSRDGDFLDMWGEHGSGDGQLDRPSGIAFDAEENLHVVDTMNNRVQKFTKDGRFLSNWGTFGDGDGEFNMPWGIAIDELGDIYVVDWRNDRVQKFSADGKLIFKFGRSGIGEGELRRPSGIDVDKDGDIYVADFGNHRVQLYAPDGHFVQKFIGDATLSRSTLERMMTRAGRFQRVRESANHEQEKRLDSPKSVRVDDQGRMFVPDFWHYRIQVYQKEAYALEESAIIPPLRAPTLNYN